MLGLHLDAGEILSVETEQLDLVDLLILNVQPQFNTNTTFTPTPTPIKTTTDMPKTSEKTTTTTTTSQANPTTTTVKAGSSRQLGGTNLCSMALLYLISRNFLTQLEVQILCIEDI